MTNYKALSGTGLYSAPMIVFIRTLLLLFLFFLLTSMEGYSQGKNITIDGREAILKPNGKWEYVKKEKKELQGTKTECFYSKNHIDNLNGTIIKILDREKIVSYTNEKLKKVFSDQDYITIDAYLSNYNNNFALFLKIKIRTNNPHTAYGSIYKDNQLIIKLKNGQTVTLYSGQSESGTVDYTNDKTSYLTFFELNEATLESLQSAELKMLRLYWSKGYEDYPILNPNFFIRQIKCVK